MNIDCGGKLSNTYLHIQRHFAAEEVSFLNDSVSYFLTRALQGGGTIFAPPPYRFSAISPAKLRTDHRQIFNALQAINLTHPDKRKTR